MELPQPRPFGTEGRKPTHDFLSLYSPPPVQQEHPRPSPQVAYLETHDFLQPLDRVGKNISKEGKKIEVTSIEKPPTPAPPPSVERTLPGGIGTYSISHVSYINQSQRVPIPEGVMYTVAQSSSSDKNDENSNCSSYTGNGFTLWEESAMKKGKTGKENITGDRQVIREAGMKIGGGQWTASMDRQSLSSSNHNHRNTNISSLSSSQPSSAPRNQSFVDMIKSARSAQENDDDDDEEEFVIKKESSPNHKANLSVKVDPKGTDQKPNTPRSKHSATEQRRRSKINDRFSMLRELIPHGDQKRDKASFLLEVIEYIQYLQEKVNKYEDTSYQGWSNGPTKLIPWGNNQRPTEGFIDQPRTNTSGPPLAYPKFDENTPSVPPTIPRNGQNLVESSNMNSADTIKEADRSRLTNKVSPFPAALQSNVFPPGGNSNATAPVVFSADNGESQPQSQLWNSRSCLNECSDKLKEQELTIDSGTISVSALYSQGLLNTLTHALQNSGVDLSQASISVQIDLGKRANCTSMNSSTSMHKKNEGPTSNHQALARSRIMSSTGEECDVQAIKRFKTGIS